MTEADLHPTTEQVANNDRFTFDHLADRLEGRDGGLRTSKPQAQDDTGLEVAIWRSARFNSGQDPSIPVTCWWELDDWLEAEGIDASVSGIQDDAGEQIRQLIDEMSMVILAERFGIDPRNGTLRWRKALYGE